MTDAEVQRKLRLAYGGLKTRVMNNCREKGLRQAELELEYLEQHPNTPLTGVLDWTETVEAYKEGIAKYKAILDKPDDIR